MNICPCRCCHVFWHTTTKKRTDGQLQFFSFSSQHMKFNEMGVTLKPYFMDKNHTKNTFKHRLRLYNVIVYAIALRQPSISSHPSTRIIKFMKQNLIWMRACALRMCVRTTLSLLSSLLFYRVLQNCVFISVLWLRRMNAIDLTDEDETMGMPTDVNDTRTYMRLFLTLLYRSMECTWCLDTLVRVVLKWAPYEFWGN